MVANGTLLLPPSAWVIPGRPRHVSTPQRGMALPPAWIRPEPLVLFDGRGTGPALPDPRRLEPGDAWRAFARPGVRYLDIETTGLGPDARITVVGISDGARALTLVAGSTLTSAALARALRGATLLVTFNGARFDLPRLRRAFPELDWSLPHFDLAREGHTVGLGGGLKALQRRLDLPRDPEVEGCDGSVAPELWSQSQAGDPRALARLRRYCRADVEALVHLAPKVLARLVAS
ncbi:MAG: ribonuclease H-like domain-containing protein [Planctomycetota bacterium]